MRRVSARCAARSVPGLRSCAAKAEEATTTTSVDPPPFWKKAAKEVLPVVVGFGVGWGAWTGLRSAGVVTDDQQMEWYIRFIEAAHSLRYDLLPASVKDALDARLLLTVPDPEMIRSGLFNMRSEQQDDQQDKVPFRKVLLNCDVEEQLDWLTEHAEETIPYIFTEELFHTWASLYYGLAFLGIPLPEVSDVDSAQVMNLAPAARNASKEKNERLELTQPQGSTAIAPLWQALKRRAAVPSVAPESSPTAMDGTDELARGVWHKGVRSQILSQESAWATLALLAHGSPKNAVGMALHALNVRRRDEGVAAARTKIIADGVSPADSEAYDEALHNAAVEELKDFQWQGQLRTEAECVKAFTAFLAAAANSTTGARKAEDDHISFETDVAERQVVRRPLSLLALAADSTHDAPDAMVRLAVPPSAAASAATAATFDPLLLTVRAVDTALMAEARACRCAQHSFLWTRPGTWARPVTRLFTAAPPPPVSFGTGAAPSLLDAAVAEDPSLRRWAQSYVAASATVHQASAAQVPGTDTQRAERVVVDSKAWLSAWTA